MGAFKPWHWVVIFVLLILLFGGANKLPDFAANLGQSLKVFKKEVKELREEDDAGAQQKPPAQIQQPQEGTYYTQPTQPGQAAPQSNEAAPQQAPQSTDDAAPRA